MFISFDPVTSIKITGTADGSLLLSVTANGLAITDRTAVCNGSLLLHGDAEANQFGEVDITHPVLSEGQLFAAGDAVGYLRLWGVADGSLSATGQSYGTGPGTVTGFAEGGFDLTGEAMELAPLTAYGFLVERPHLMEAYCGRVWEGVNDGLTLGGRMSSLPIYGLMELAGLGGSGSASFHGLVRVTGRLTFDGAVLVVLRELLAEGFAFDASTSDQRRALERVIDGLRLTGLATSQLEALSIVTAAIAYGAMARDLAVLTATDGIELGDDGAARLRAAVALVDALLLEAQPGAAVRLMALVPEAIGLGGATATALTAMEALREGLSFALHLTLDDAHYVAYVINTESKAVSQYAHYPFNSFAKLGGRYYGMTPAGLHELEGPDDAGSPIAARIRLAMSTLGTGHMKRMIAAYLGYTSTGELRIKTITVGVDGVKQANHYRLHAQPASAPREARIQIGQGLRSVYWGFEVEAIDGAAFALDVLDLQPIVVEGRIQGEGGGKR